MQHASNICTTPDGAAALIKAGGVLIFPTETFFGMGSRALDADATAKVFRIKRRSNMRPLPLVAANEEQLDMVCRMPDGLLALLAPFWPGPLSVILPARLRVPEIVNGGTGKVAVRMSPHPGCHNLALAVGEPLTASSANISGAAPVTSVEALDPDLVQGVDGVFDALPAPGGGLPSTLIEPQEEPHMVRILRAGAVSRAQLEHAGFIIVPEPPHQGGDA